MHSFSIVEYFLAKGLLLRASTGSIKLLVSILFIVFSFQQRRVTTCEMTYFNSEYNCYKEVPKASYICFMDC